MTIFSKIAQGEIPSYKCAENEEFYAFLDINTHSAYLVAKWTISSTWKTTR